MVIPFPARRGSVAVKPDPPPVVLRAPARRFPTLFYATFLSAMLWAGLAVLIRF